MALERESHSKTSPILMDKNRRNTNQKVICQNCEHLEYELQKTTSEIASCEMIIKELQED
jgi:hypothetical protein